MGRPAERAHRCARERGVSPALYATVRVLATVALRSWFRLRVTGPEHVPRMGAAIVGRNHACELGERALLDRADL